MRPCGQIQLKFIRMKLLFQRLLACQICLLVTCYHANAQKKLALLFIGNSITQGSGGPNGNPPPTHTVNYLRQQKSYSDVIFVNIGRSGSTTLDWLPGSGRYASKVVSMADSLYALKAYQLVFSLKLGTNDSAMEGPTGAPVSKENYGENLSTIVTDLLKRYPDSKVVIHQPIWYSTNTYNRSKYLEEGLNRLQSYFPVIKQVVKDYQKTHAGHVFRGDRKAFKYFKKHHLAMFKPENGQQGTFYLHPNEAGVAVLGTYWGKAMARIKL